MFKYIFLPLFLICNFISINCQQGYLINETNRLKFFSVENKGLDFHPSIISQDFDRDSSKQSFSKRINPIFDLSTLIGMDNKTLISSRLGGLFDFNVSEKLKGNISIYDHSFALPDFLKDLSDSLNFVPKYGNSYYNKENIFSTLNIRGNIVYRPYSFLAISVGNDKHFIGNGHRSLFLSDNSGSYPYFSTSLKIWHVQYQSMTTFLKDIYYDDSLNFSYKRKFATLHYISWNITRSINLNLFEAVLWRGSDSVLYNGMNINYLNPVIFMRPVEYSQGSTDNAILGAGLNFMIGKKMMFFSQAILDEFYVKEIKNKDYRDNKFGFQLGLKGAVKRLNIFPTH